MTCVIMYGDYVLADSVCIAPSGNETMMNIDYACKLFQTDDLIYSVIGATQSETVLRNLYGHISSLIHFSIDRKSEKFKPISIADLNIVGDVDTIFCATKYAQYIVKLKENQILIDEIIDNTKPIVAGCCRQEVSAYFDYHKPLLPYVLMSYAYRSSSLVGGPTRIARRSELRSFTGEYGNSFRKANILTKSGDEQ